MYLSSGQIYEGIFHGADTQKELGIVLKMARPFKKQSAQVEPQLRIIADIVPQLVIDAKDFEAIEALDVDLSFGETGVFSDNQGTVVLICCVVFMLIRTPN